MKKLFCTCLLIALLCNMLTVSACPALADGEPIEIPPVQSGDSIEMIETLPDQSDVSDLEIPHDAVIDGDVPSLDMDDMDALDLNWTGDVPLTLEDENLTGTEEEFPTAEPGAENTRSDDDLRSGFYYYRIVDGNAVITDVEQEPVYNDKGDVVGWDKLQYVSVDIPQAIDGHPVTRIEGGTFKDAKNLKKVSLPDSLKEIGWGAFANCEALSDVTLPAGLELLDCNAFSYCVSLKSINIPLGVKTHGYVTERAYPGPFNGSGLSEVRFADGIEAIVPGLFEFCGAMESITLPDTVVEIGRGAFMGCPSLKSVGLPASLKRINWSAFDGCTALSDITLPDGLEYLDCFVFNGCASLKKINLPKNVACHGYVTEHAYSGPFVNCENLCEIEFAKDMKTVPKGIFFRCPGIRSITIPDTVETIEYGAFDTCSNLVTVNLPKSVSRINDYAFCWCPKLKNITLPANLGYLGLGAFKGCEALNKINIPAKVEMHGYVAANSYYPGPFSECSGLRKVTFAKGMTTIPHGLFYQCNGIRKITLPESIVTIENDAFCRCDSLTQVKLGKKVKTIGNYAFSYCDNLESIGLTETVRSIGDYAFARCEKLKKVTLPAKLTYMGLGAYIGCASLRKISIPAKLKTNSSCGENKNYPGPFAECKNLKTVTFAKGITGIPNGLFYRCNGIQKITIPDSVVTIDHDAFCVCDNLTSVKLGKKVKTIGEYCFAYSEKLASVNLPQTVREIKNYAFDGCKHLKNITLPAKLDYLGNGAFRNCVLLSEIEIPAKLKTYESCGQYSDCPGPFSGCENLETVTFGWGIATIPNGLFYQCNGLKKITLPYTVVSIEHAAFCLCSALKEIHIGQNVKTIGEYAFSDCNALEHVYYALSKASWTAIEIGDNNAPLLEAELHVSKTDPTQHHRTSVGADSLKTLKSKYPSLKKLSNCGTFEIPGLVNTHTNEFDCCAMTPQGICVTDKYILITAYCGIDDWKSDLDKAKGKANNDLKEKEKNHEKHGSVIYVIDRSSGNLMKTVALPDNGHVGGIAYDKDRNCVWIAGSGNKAVYGVTMRTLDGLIGSNNDQIIKYNYKQSVDIDSVSFLTYFENKLWVGRYESGLLKSGDLKVFSVDNNCHVTHSPVYTAKIPRYANGLEVVRNDSGKLYLFLNASAGRKKDSIMYIYGVKEKKNSISLEKKKTMTLLPMAEEICIVGGSDKDRVIYTIYESGASRYSTIKGNKAKYVTDLIYMGKLSSVIS